MRRMFTVTAMVSALALSALAPAMANPTTVTDNASPSACFGQWRASSVQAYNETMDEPVGHEFARRAGDNASINAGHRLTDCPA
jgi:type IV secretory pathway protease TraF